MPLLLDVARAWTFWLLVIAVGFILTILAGAEEFHPSQDLAAWFEHLKRPDYNAERDGSIISCCDFGDAYPVRIIEEATIGGANPDGVAEVTDGSAREIVTPAGVRKYRGEIKGSRIIHFAGEKITRERDGNPTGTAWAFLRVNAGEINFVYCIVPLPPGF